MKRIKHEDLLSIRRPVLLLLNKNYAKNSKVRILYPNGKCEYDFIDSFATYFTRSCFKAPSLIGTIKAMKEYDDSMGGRLYLIAEL